MTEHRGNNSIFQLEYLYPERIQGISLGHIEAAHEIAEVGPFIIAGRYNETAEPPHIYSCGEVLLL